MIEIPDNFQMDSYILIENEDGSFWDPLTFATHFYDSDGNRYKYYYYNYNNVNLATTISNYNTNEELRFDGTTKKCTKAEIKVPLNIRNFLHSIFNKDS